MYIEMVCTRDNNHVTDQLQTWVMYAYGKDTNLIRFWGHMVKCQGQRCHGIHEKKKKMNVPCISDLAMAEA